MRNDVMRRSMTVKQAVSVGASLAVISAAAAAARSDAPLPVFGEYVLVGLVAVLLGVGSFLAIKRLRAGRPGAGDMPPLNVRRAVTVGLIVGVVLQAAVSTRSSMPLFTFASNVATVLWVALLAALVMLAIERHQSKGTAIH
jgi:hypothetical protein